MNVYVCIYVFIPINVYIRTYVYIDLNVYIFIIYTYICINYVYKNIFRTCLYSEPWICIYSDIYYIYLCIYIYSQPAVLFTLHTLKEGLSFRGVLQCVAVCCSVLQCVAIWWEASNREKSDHCLQCVAVCCNMLQCVAMCCNELQCALLFEVRHHSSVILNNGVALLLNIEQWCCVMIE